MMDGRCDTACRRIPGQVALAGLLVFVYVAVSLYMSLQAPCGDIPYSYLARTASENYPDPDAFYLCAGVSFFREHQATWPGHPGMTLQGLVGLTAEVACRIFGQGSDDMAYYEFVLRNWIRILIAVRILMTFVSLGCVFLVYGLARYCTNTTGWAVVAAALYATSHPFLLYLNRLVPEPFTMLFSLAAIYCLWRAIPAREAGQGGRAALWLCLAGMAGAATCFEKFYNGLLLLPVLGLGWLLEWRTWAGGQGWRYAFRFAGALILGFLLASVLFMQKPNMAEFLVFWRQGLWMDRHAPCIGKVPWSWSFIWSLFTRFALSESNTNLVKGGILLLSELPLLLFGCLGLLALRGQNARGRRRLLILALFGASAIVLIVLRGAYTGVTYVFFYFHPLLAVASVLTATGMRSLVAWCSGKTPLVRSWYNMVLAACLVFLLHETAVTMYLYTQGGLQRAYRKNAQKYVDVLDRLPAGRRIGVNLDKRANRKKPVFANLYMLGITTPEAVDPGFNPRFPVPCWKAADRVFCITNTPDSPAWPDDVAITIADEIEPWPAGSRSAP